MLVLNNKLDGLAVASVQATHRIGQSVGYVIDPRNLHIAALYVSSNRNPEPLLLHTSDIREFSLRGVIIDHDDQLMEAEGLVRLQQIININFVLIGKKVVTEDGKKLGKVSSFSFDTTTWLIMRFNVDQSLAKSFGTSQLIIHRQQVVKVTDNEVVVKSTAVKDGSKFSLKKLFLGNPKPALNPDSSSSQES